MPDPRPDASRNQTPRSLFRAVHNIELSCAAESDDLRRFDGPNFPSPTCTQADNCSDLLSLPCRQIAFYAYQISSWIDCSHVLKLLSLFAMRIVGFCEPTLSILTAFYMFRRAAIFSSGLSRVSSFTFDIKAEAIRCASISPIPFP